MFRNSGAGALAKTGKLAVAYAFGVALASGAYAAQTIKIMKSGDRCVDDPNCHNRWHPDIKPVAKANPGDTIVFGTRDALDHALNRNSTAKDIAGVNLNLVHPLTGPLYVEGAEPGDVLAVELLDVEPDKFGFTTIVPGFGFLRDLYTEPFVVRWDLTRQGATSPDLPGIKVKLDGFLGTVGVAPGPGEVDTMKAREAALAAAGGVALPPEPKDALPKSVCGEGGSAADKCLRTIPPRENGGNMDIKQMQVGSTMLFPCFVKGCLLSIGDVHYAQGDGEVSGTAIEMDATVKVRVSVRKGLGAQVKTVHYEGGKQVLSRITPKKFYATVGYPLKPAGQVPATHKYLDGTKIAGLTNLSEDVTLAARDALIHMIDWLVKNKGLSREQAYCLASVAVDLRIGNLVDVPNFAVSAILDLGVFTK